MHATWNLPPPPGFQGLRDDLPLAVYEQHLPHWRQDGATYFVTFRLADSLPQSKLRELESFKRAWTRQHAGPFSREDKEDLTRKVMQRVEAWLDQGMGRCVLRDGNASRILTDAMHRNDGVSHELDCYVVMPNHVHAVLRPLVPKTEPLEIVLQAWKGVSRCAINRHLGQSGTLWQRESFDRIIRDEEHLWRVIQYIGRNPKHAGPSSVDVPLWIRPAWRELGWRFDSA